MSKIIGFLKRFRRYARLKYLLIVFRIKHLIVPIPVESFTCNICAKTNTAPLASIAGRETPSCFQCGSTLRFRAVIHALSLALFGESHTLPTFPTSKQATGLGMSDSDIYAALLAKKLDYTNTYFHTTPHLDITNVADQREVDFIISSDVLEHVAPPIMQAINNLAKLLRSGGFCILTVPYQNDGDAIEHFPELHTYRLEKSGGKKQLVNVAQDGRQQVFENLRFHGGAGATLEMRIFSRPVLRKQLLQAGFREVQFCDQDVPEFGIIWQNGAAVPIIARK